MNQDISAAVAALAPVANDPAVVDIAGVLENYVKVMGGGTPVSGDVIATQQRQLWNALRTLTRREPRSFTQAWTYWTS